MSGSELGTCEKSEIYLRHTRGHYAYIHTIDGCSYIYIYDDNRLIVMLVVIESVIPQE